MKTKEFLSILKEQPSKKLLFEYRTGQFVAPGYHITEIKNVTVDAVDCGAGTDFWKETIIQLWEDQSDHTDQYMSAEKALDILLKVNRIKPMEKDVEVKFEYSNPNFHTAQLFINNITVDEDAITLKLGIEKTDCKAKETCGITSEPVKASSAECTPGGGCC